MPGIERLELFSGHPSLVWINVQQQRCSGLVGISQDMLQQLTCDSLALLLSWYLDLEEVCNIRAKSLWFTQISGRVIQHNGLGTANRTVSGLIADGTPGYLLRQTPDPRRQPAPLTMWISRLARIEWHASPNPVDAYAWVFHVLVRDLVRWVQVSGLIPQPPWALEVRAGES